MCGEGGVNGEMGTCEVAGGHAWLLGRGCGEGGMHGEWRCVVKGVCMV